MSSTVRAVAKVTVDLEVVVGPYGDGWTIEEIMKQAKREAPQAIQNMIQETKRGTIRVVGSPLVDVVITTEKP